MSEALVSSSALNDYLSSVDMTLADNRRVLAGVQTLDPNILESIMYYLVVGKVNISQLYSIDINNLSIKHFITQLDMSDSIVNLRIFYKNKIKALPSYAIFKNVLKESAAVRLSNMSLSVDELMSTVEIDPLGGTNKYRSFVEVMNIYDTIIFSLPTQTKFNAVVEAANVLKNSHGFTNIVEFNQAQLEIITQYGLVKSSGVEKNVVASNTFLGFIARNMFSTMSQSNLVTNINDVALKMAINDTLDIPRDGVYTLKQLMALDDYKYKSIFNINYVYREPAFLAKLFSISFIRKELYCTIYGPNYFLPAEIAAEVNTYNAVINYFTKVNELYSYIHQQCKTLIVKA